MTSKQQFIDKVRKLDVEQLKALFEALKSDDKTPLGMLHFVSQTYNEKLNGVTTYIKVKK